MSSRRREQTERLKSSQGAARKLVGHRSSAMAPDRATRWLMATILAVMPGYSLALAVSTVLPSRGLVRSRMLRSGPCDVQMLEAFGACMLRAPSRTRMFEHTPKKRASRNRKRGVSRTGMCASEVRTRTDCETRPGRSLVCVSCVASVLFMRRLLWWSSGLVRLVVALWARICSD